MLARVVLLGLLLICVTADAADEFGSERKPSCPNAEELVACPLNLAPVCGSDGNTYANECVLCVERQGEVGQSELQPCHKSLPRKTKMDILVVKEEGC